MTKFDGAAQSDGARTRRVASSLRKLTQKRSHEVSALLDQLNHTLSEPEPAPAGRLLHVLKEIVAGEYRFLHDISAELHRLPNDRSEAA